MKVIFFNIISASNVACLVCKWTPSPRNHRCVTDESSEAGNVQKIRTSHSYVKQTYATEEGF